MRDLWSDNDATQNTDKKLIYSLRSTTTAWNPGPPNFTPRPSRFILSPDGELAALTKTVWTKFGSWMLSFKMLFSPDWIEGGSVVSQACIWAPCPSWICPARCSRGRRSESRARKASQPTSSCSLVLSKIWYAGPCVTLKRVRNG